MYLRVVQTNMKYVHYSENNVLSCQALPGVVKLYRDLTTSILSTIITVEFNTLYKCLPNLNTEINLG